MVHGWVSFPVKWSLQDVQAGLTVLIAFLCAGGIFVVVRWSWQVAARRVVSQKRVPRYALLSLNTIGEAIDIIYLLRREIFQRRYHALLTQCIVVLLLTAATLVAGFIARSSTRHGPITSFANINGTLATNDVQYVDYADTQVNQTISSLQRTNFPIDRLLDYLPDSSSEWEYSPDEWNSTWSMTCEFVPRTPVTLAITDNNCTDSDVQYQLPFLDTLYPANEDWSYVNNWSGWEEGFNIWNDILIFLHGSVTDDVNSQNETTNMTIRSVAMHLHNVAANNSSPLCNFNSTPSQPAQYTVATCNLFRSLNDSEPDPYFRAGPDNGQLQSVADAMIQHWAQQMRKESIRGMPISIPNGTELAQFYQAYSVVRDTVSGPYVMRNLTRQYIVAQISLACLIVVCIGAVLVLGGLIQYYVFYFRHREMTMLTPQSKLDWFLQTIGHDGDLNSARDKIRSSTMLDGSLLGETVPLAATKSISSRNSGYTPDPGPRAVSRVASGSSGYVTLNHGRDVAMDTSYDPIERLDTPMGPIEDGFFQTRLT